MRLRFLFLLSLASLLLPAARAATDDPIAAENAAWRARRLARLTRPDGWLTLIGLHWLRPGENTVGTAPGNTIVLTAGPAHFGSVHLDAAGVVTFQPADGSGVTMDGKSAAPGRLEYANEAHPTTVTSGTVSFYVIQRAGKLGLRVKDSASPHRLQFGGLDYFPIDPAWRITARWVPYDRPRDIKLTDVLGLIETQPSPGYAEFTHDGHVVHLVAVDEGPDVPLFFILTDETAGRETYEACRFLYAERPKDGHIVLDFNQCYNPPCAFTTFATCALPPRENRLPFPVPAGEKKYRGDQP